MSYRDDEEGLDLEDGDEVLSLDDEAEPSLASKDGLSSSVSKIAAEARMAIAHGHKALELAGARDRPPLPPHSQQEGQAASSSSSTSRRTPGARTISLERSAVGGTVVPGTEPVSAELLRSRVLLLQRQLQLQRPRLQELEELERQEKLERLERQRRQERQEQEMEARRTAEQLELERRALELERKYVRRTRQLEVEARQADQRALEINEQLEVWQLEQQEKHEGLRQELLEVQQSTQRMEAAAKQRVKSQRDARDRAEKAMETVKCETRDAASAREEVAVSEKSASQRLRAQLLKLREELEETRQHEVSLAVDVRKRNEELALVEREARDAEQEAEELAVSGELLEECLSRSGNVPSSSSRAPPKPDLRQLEVEEEQMQQESRLEELRRELRSVEEGNRRFSAEEQTLRRQLAHVEAQAAHARESLQRSPRTVVARFSGPGGRCLLQEHDAFLDEIGILQSKLAAAEEEVAEVAEVAVVPEDDTLQVSDELADLDLTSESALESVEALEVSLAQIAALHRSEMAVCSLELLQAETEEARRREETYRASLQGEWARLQADSTPLALCAADSGGAEPSTGAKDAELGEIWWEPRDSELAVARVRLSAPLGLDEDLEVLRQRKVALAASLECFSDEASAAECPSQRWWELASATEVMEAECQDFCEEVSRLLEDMEVASRLADAKHVEAEMDTMKEGHFRLEREVESAWQEVESARFRVEDEVSSVDILRGRLDALIAEDKDLDCTFHEMAGREQAAAEICAREEEHTRALGLELQQAHLRCVALDAEVQACTSRLSQQEAERGQEGAAERLGWLPQGADSAEADEERERSEAAAAARRLALIREEGLRFCEMSVTEQEVAAELRAELLALSSAAETAQEEEEQEWNAISQAQAAELSVVEAQIAAEEEAHAEVASSMALDEDACKSALHKLAVGRAELAFWTAESNLEAISARLRSGRWSEAEAESSLLEEEMDLRRGAEKLFEESVLMLDSLTAEAPCNAGAEMEARFQRLEGEIGEAERGLHAAQEEILAQAGADLGQQQHASATPRELQRGLESPRRPLENKLVQEIQRWESLLAKRAAEPRTEDDEEVLTEMHHAMKEAYGLLGEQKRALETASIERDRLQAQLSVVLERISRQQAGLLPDPPPSALTA